MAAATRASTKTRVVETFQETWQNSTAGRVVIEKFSETGALIAVMIAGNKRFTLSAQERRVNQEKAASAEQDVFQNGILQPVTLDEGEPDAAKLLSNPNVLNADAQRALFEMSADEFADRLAKITHVAVLNRLLEVAVELDVSMSRYRMVEARLDAVAPLLATEIVTAASGTEAIAGRAPAAVSPR